MEFRRFEEAARLYGNKKYTMCHFLNLVKCAANDISDEYGDVYELQVGDENNFADLISNQCFIIEEMLDTAEKNPSGDRVEKLRRELSTLKNRADDIKSSMNDIEDLKKQKQELEKNIEELEKEKKEYKKLADSVEAARNSINEADSFDFEKAKQELSELQKELDEKTQNNSKIITEVNDCKAKINDIKNSNQTLENELITLGNEQTETNKKHIELEEKKTAVNTEIELLKKNIAQIEITIKSLEGPLELYSENVKKCSDTFDNEKSSLSLKNEKLISYIIRTGKEIEDLKIRINEAGRQKRDLEAEKNSLSDILKNIESVSNDIKKDIDILKDDYSKWENHFAELSESSDDIMSEASDKLLADYAELSKEYNRFYNQTLKPELEKQKDIQKKIDSKDKALTDQITQNEALTDKLNELNANFESISANNISIEKNISEIQRSLEPVEKKYIELSGQYNTLSSKLTNINRRNFELEHNDIPNAGIMIDEANNILSSHEKKLEEKANELSGMLGNEYKVINLKMMELDETLKQKEDELKNTGIEFNEKTNKIASYDQEIIKMKEQIKALEDQNESEKRENINKHLENQKQDLNDQIENRKALKDKLNSKIKELKESNEKDLNEYNNLNKLKDDLEKEKSRLESSIGLLKVYAGEGSQKQLEEIKSRLSVLDPVRDKMERMLRHIQDITGEKYITKDEEQKVTQYARALDSLLDIIPDIQKDLWKIGKIISDEKMIIKEI